MRGVTISASYGTGGGLIARHVAERLGLPLLDRAISSRVAQQLHVSTEEAETGMIKRSLVERFFGVLAPMAGGVVGIGTETMPDAPLPMDDAAEFRERAESIMRRALDETGAVILGRAGGAALQDRADVLRVRLFGSREARIAQAARLEGGDERAVAQRLPEVDRARAQYVKRLYGRDIDDPALYQLQIESTRLPLEGCVEIIVAGYRACA